METWGAMASSPEAMGAAPKRRKLVDAPAVGAEDGCQLEASLGANPCSRGSSMHSSSDAVAGPSSRTAGSSQADITAQRQGMGSLSISIPTGVMRYRCGKPVAGWFQPCRCVRVASTPGR